MTVTTLPAVIALHTGEVLGKRMELARAMAQTWQDSPAPNYRWLEFRERFLFPALGVLIAVPLGVGLTLAIASAAGSL